MTIHLDRLRGALARDRTIDIVTTGARSGLRRTTEIWFNRVDGRIILCGTPSAGGAPGITRQRDWLANLRRTPRFEFCFKESVQTCVAAFAREIRDPDDRRAIMSAPETAWYRDQGYTVEELAAGGPIVEVTFLPPYEGLNR